LAAREWAVATAGVTKCPDMAADGEGLLGANPSPRQWIVSGD
jgi:hypothetical protein